MSLPAVSNQHWLALKGQHQGLSLPEAFAQEIYLMSFPLAGVMFHAAASGIEASLAGEDLAIVREPDNRHDKYAVGLLTTDGRMLGYIPRDRNRIPARLIDAGKGLRARVKGIRYQESHPEIKVALYMENL